MMAASSSKKTAVPASAIDQHFVRHLMLQLRKRPSAIKFLANFLSLVGLRKRRQELGQEVPEEWLKESAPVLMEIYEAARKSTGRALTYFQQAFVASAEVEYEPPQCYYASFEVSRRRRDSAEAFAAKWCQYSVTFASDAPERCFWEVFYRFEYDVQRNSYKFQAIMHTGYTTSEIPRRMPVEEMRGFSLRPLKDDEYNSRKRYFLNKSPLPHRRESDDYFDGKVYQFVNSNYDVEGCVGEQAHSVQKKAKPKYLSAADYGDSDYEDSPPRKYLRV